MSLREPDLVSKLREVLQAARRFVRGRHSSLTYGPQALLEQIDAAIALLGREGQAAESPADPLFTELQIRRWLHYFKDDYAAMASAINAVVKQAYKAVQPSPSTPIVPGTPDDPRFDGVVVEVAEEFAILDEDIPALRQILARLQPAAGLSAEQVASAIAANKLLPDPPGGFDMKGIAKDLNAVLGAVKPAPAAILTGPDGTGIGTGINAERPAPAGEAPTNDPPILIPAGQIVVRYGCGATAEGINPPAACPLHGISCGAGEVPTRKD